jgi:hypothetical protein
VQSIEIVALATTTIALVASGAALHFLRLFRIYRHAARVVVRVLRDTDPLDYEPLGAEGRVLFYELRRERHEEMRLLPLRPAEADELEVLRAGLRALGRRA